MRHPVVPPSLPVAAAAGRLSKCKAPKGDGKEGRGRRKEKVRHPLQFSPGLCRGLTYFRPKLSDPTSKFTTV